MLQHALFFLLIIFYSFDLSAQENKRSANSAQQEQRFTDDFVIEGEPGNSAGVLALTDCIRYALKNQPALNQAYIDEAIARTNNAIAFSPWLPQVSGSANLQHYFQTPVSFTTINGVVTPVQNGATNISIPSIAASQTIFNTDVLLATKAARLNTESSRENTTARKIDLVATVSKAFYDLLLSVEQIRVYKEDTTRLVKNKKDAYNRYLSGITDKVDYKQAAIALNNSLASLKNASETVTAKYAALKQLMGYPADKKFTIHFDTAQMMQEIYVDTLATLQFEKRIEYSQLQTAKKMQRETTMYYQLGFLPSLSAFYDYNYEFENSKFSDLYDRAYPYSLLGLQLNLPLFTGFRRNENIHKAKLQERRIDWDEVNLKLIIYTQYRQALAGYKSNLYYLHAQADNVEMAREVYNIVMLQYREGVKAYLDVIVAESDLQTSEINYLNALFQLLESKIDLERALGDIPTEI
jgi:outer membrane protein TolC